LAKPKIKLVAVDLDDTLLGPDLAVSARNRQALWRARQQGVRVVPATGRMFRSAQTIALRLGLRDPVIAYQGALVRWPAGEEIAHLPLPLALAREVLARVAPAGFHVNVYVDDNLYVAELTEEAKRYAALSGVPVQAVGDLAAFLSRDPTKVLVVAPETELDRLARDLAPHWGDRLTMNKSKPHFLEFSHREATKGRALARLAALFGLRREEVMAIGDGYNDLDMVEYAGIGVVMGNARPEVRARADWVTAANDADGVAEAVERFVLGGGV